MSELAYYVYCIAEKGAPAELSAQSLPSAIEENTKLEWITVGGLAALSSRVPLASYSEEKLAEHLSDASWTAVRAMRHETVMEYVAKHTAVVPLRFGTIYLERAGVERMLKEKRNELADIIERLRGRVEWGVNVFCNRSTLIAAITSFSPLLQGMVEEAEQSSPGKAYLMKRKIDALREREAGNILGKIIDYIEAELAAEADDTKRLRVLKVEATEHGELKAKFACLVEKSEFEDFRDVAEQLAGHYQNAGIRLELTGPWPCYNFTGLNK